ncbi:MAG: hypothetical protein AAGI71_18750 [Bacteroidota bacterium]
MQAQSTWRVLKKYVQDEVQVVEETNRRLVLYHTTRQDTLVVTTRQDPGADIWGRVEQRRGSNPYRVWTASAQFWENPVRPREAWGQYFRSGFLRILRPPPRSDDGP